MSDTEDHEDLPKFPSDAVNDEMAVDAVISGSPALDDDPGGPGSQTQMNQLLDELQDSDNELPERLTSPEPAPKKPTPKINVKDEPQTATIPTAGSRKKSRASSPISISSDEDYQMDDEGQKQEDDDEDMYDDEQATGSGGQDEEDEDEEEEEHKRKHMPCLQFHPF